MAVLPRKLTVLQVTPRLASGGVEQATLDLNAGLIARGHRSLVASEGGPLEARLVADGGEAVRLPVASKNPLTILANAGRLADVARREGVDLIHVRSRAPAYSALMAARRTDVPIVSTYHGIYAAKGTMKRAYNSIMARADRVMANSAFTLEHVRAEHGVDDRRLALVPEGVDPARFDPASVSAERQAAMRASWGLGESDTRRVLLLPARLTRWKGQAVLIDAFSRAAPPDWVLVLAGDDQGRQDYRDELEAHAADLWLGTRVRIVGEVADMAAAYVVSDLIATPSVEAESFGRTAVEAQMAGRPVIASDLGASRETVDPALAGWRARPGDVDAWAAVLGQALALPRTDSDLMGERARSRAVERFSLDAMIEATLGVYADALGERP